MQENIVKILDDVLAGFDATRNDCIGISVDEIMNIIRKRDRCLWIESMFCCYGPEASCWSEVYDRNVWGATQEDVIKMLEFTLREIEEAIEEPGRIYQLNTHENMLEIYIFARDTKFVKDVHIKAWNEGEVENDKRFLVR